MSLETQAAVFDALTALVMHHSGHESFFADNAAIIERVYRALRKAKR